MTALRDHGGRLDAARARHGGARRDWLDLSTGINPVAYPVPPLPRDAWTALPDAEAEAAFRAAARAAWDVPEGAAVMAAPGASALIARIPQLAAPGVVRIPAATYNEHAAAFRSAGWRVVEAAEAAEAADAAVVVHPNNPDGRWFACPDAPLTVIDESFCDVAPERSMVAAAKTPGVLVLKSFGKFWGLAGLRLGAVIGDPALVARLGEALGPWPVSGPALAIGTAALRDAVWADGARDRIRSEAQSLDRILSAGRGEVIGGTPLFRLIRHAAAADLAERLAERQILVRRFPYAPDWIRVGLPGPGGMDRLAAALG